MARETFGTVVKIGTANPPTTTLAGVVSVDPPSIEGGTEDVTSHDSVGGAMEFIPDAVYDPGALTITVNHVKGSATDAACRAAVTSRVMYYVQWTENAASGSETLQAAGVPVSYKVNELPVKGKQTATLSIKLSGVIDEDV